MSATQTVHDYYEALRRGEPLYPYFAERDDVVKFGVSETLTGYDEVAEGLREQSRRTDEWTVQSRQLRVAEQEGFAWFSDTVTLEWLDTVDEAEYAYETRWSGTLVNQNDEWLFVNMHVSAAQER